LIHEIRNKLHMAKILRVVFLRFINIY
jgi:hypothetical protein